MTTATATIKPHNTAREADAQAREAGLVVLASGRLYHAAPSRLSGVFVERVGDLWEAYAVTWRPER